MRLLRSYGDTDKNDGKENGIVESALNTECLANGRTELRVADDAPQENGIGRSECCSEHSGEYDGNVEKPGSDG